MTFQTDTMNTRTIRSLEGVPTSMKLAFMALRSTRIGRMEVSLPDGRLFTFDHGIPGPRARIDVLNLKLAQRVLAHGDIGFAEGYMDDQFSTPDLTETLKFFAVNFETAGRLGTGSPIKSAITFIMNALTKRNTKSGSKRNIIAHYDLGNDFYDKWLDPTMTYSSAIFERDDESLEAAQKRKYEGVCERLDMTSTDHILEIGSGWAGFAEYAATTRGADVTTITISDAQHKYASKRIFEAGLAEKVKVELCDYRDVEGSFDGVASIEMIEAVGETYWPSYFGKIADVLKSGRKAALQVITIEDELFEGYKKRVDFIQKYVFPGGMLPSIQIMKEQAAAAGLTYIGEDMFGKSYAETLNRWAVAFNDAWPQIEAQGFDRSFRNLWNFYLSYCEAGFETGRTDVGQFVLAKP